MLILIFCATGQMGQVTWSNGKRVGGIPFLSVLRLEQGLTFITTKSSGLISHVAQDDKQMGRFSQLVVAPLEGYTG